MDVRPGNRRHPGERVPLGLSACSGDSEQRSSRESSASVSSAKQASAGLTAVTCSGDADVEYDHPGYPNLTALIRGESGSGGAISVDLEAQRIYFLRDDGTAHTMKTWTRGSQHRWYPDAASTCDDSEEWADVPPTASGLSGALTLDVGHCWIEPVRFDGRNWDAVEEDQFGLGGGGLRASWATGTAWVAGDLLFYEDDSGARLTFVPAGHSLTIERMGCA